VDRDARAHRRTPGLDDVGGDVAAERARIRARLAGMVPDGPVRVATGSSVAEPADLACSFDEAEVVLALAEGRGQLDAGVDVLGAEAVLLSVPVARLRAYADQWLGPLDGHPSLLATLGAWLRCGGSRAAVSAQLGVHRNSVGYRVERLRALLGDSLDTPDGRTALHVALACREIIDARERTTSERTSPERMERHGAS
jgi:DNA-binding PucR family transcriptional regulator